MLKFSRLCLVCLVWMNLVACGIAEPQAQPQPVITLLPKPTASPTAIPSSPTPQPTHTPTPAPSPTPALPETLLNNMNVEQKVGQLLLVGFKINQLVPAVRQTLTDLHIGGIVIFSDNVESPQQLAQYIRDAQEATQNNNDPALFVAVDQEGGTVSRLRADVGFTEFPSAMALAATGDANNARLVAHAMVQEMKAVGINMNLAPVMDVNNNAANPIIGIRSFGSNPQTVSLFGSTMIDEFQREGILAIAKHFPGHGDTAIDSHVGLPMIPYDRTRLDAIELVPFKAAIAQNVAGIMSAHITFPAVDNTPDLPATLSQKVQVGLLRDELKFEGIAMSDSMEMGALQTAGFSIPEASARAFAAGADVLSYNATPDVYREVHALIVQRVQSGEIPLARLDQAVRRILRAKNTFGILAAPLVDVSAAGASVRQPTTLQLANNMFAKSITLVRDTDKLIPIQKETNLFVIETPFAVGLASAFGTAGVNVGVLQVSEQPQPFEIEQAVAQATGKTVIVATYDVAINPTQADLVNALLAAKLKVIVVATRSPYDAFYLNAAPTVVALYGGNSFGVLAAGLRGEIKMEGVLPVAGT